MNKLPTKQIYLLTVIIVGLIALSVYSTYAIFTFESETSEAFNIQLPSVLEIKTDMYEYKQIEIPKNSVGTTDIDLYNTYDYELCYSIWYKVLGDDSSAIDIYEISDAGLSTNGTIAANANSRFSLLIINNSDEPTKINLGLAAIKNNDTCSLKLSSDKKNIKQTYNQEIISLKDKIIENVDKPVIESVPGSLIYKNKSVELTYSENVIISSKYTIKNSSYQLVEPQKISATDYEKNLKDLDYQNEDYFICSDIACQTIYRINEAILEEVPDDNPEIEENHDNELKVPIYNYIITNVDEYEAYNEGPSGIKKVDQNYYYYGDNPNNFIYYNCQTTDDASCELWRIIGLIYDETTEKYYLKIIRNDSLGDYQYNDNQESNTWDNQSVLHKYLNEQYSLDNKIMSIYPHTLETISNLELNINDISNTKLPTTNKEVTIMNITDYLNASTCSKGPIITFTDCLNNNWLNRIKIASEWTLTSYEEPTIDNPNSETNNPQESTDEQQTNEPTQEVGEETTNQDIDQSLENIPSGTPVKPVIKKYMYTVGKEITKTLVTENIAVRPVIYLQERVLLYSGDGTLTNPYIIK